ncbi:PREDICTED: minor histocompatibility protein HA-1 isoform X2 [Chinchilla lanigera]|uniref:Rho GTPase activating protein 45 n=1 Tax=Chinchilla lanigera TaxID=34839 RepID=A0A8C2VAL5_CHILA|nr:PREDICTED: minor histocompatibility protein HA-1 isoform X2 [Chinchilla lanigera]
MFSRKKRELMKTPSISKKNRAGSPSPQPSGELPRKDGADTVFPAPGLEPSVASSGVKATATLKRPTSLSRHASAAGFPLSGSGSWTLGRGYRSPLPAASPVEPPTEGPGAEASDDISNLLADVARVAEGLEKLKECVLHDDLLEARRPLAHECLGETLRVLHQVISKYPLLNTVETLTAAGTLIAKVKAFHYECNNELDKREFEKALETIAVSFSGAVSEFLMGEVDSSTLLAVPPGDPSQSMENLYQSSEGSPAGAEYFEGCLPPEEVDMLLQRCEGGVDVALQYAKNMAKYMKDLIGYLEKRTALEMEFAKGQQKLIHSSRQSFVHEPHMPLLSIYLLALEQDLELSHGMVQAVGTLQTQTFMQPLTLRRLEHERRRKEIKESWHRAQRKLQEAEANLRKAKQGYVQRCEDHDKARLQVAKAEEEQAATSPGAGSTASKTLDKRRRLEEEAKNKAEEAMATYRTCVADAKTQKQELEDMKVTALRQIQEVIRQSDQTIKSATISYYQMMHMQTAPLPVHFQMLCESSKLYDPGQQYASHVRQLQRGEEPDVRYDFEPHVSANSWSPVIRARKSSFNVSDTLGTEATSSSPSDEGGPSEGTSAKDHRGGRGHQVHKSWPISAADSDGSLDPSVGSGDFNKFQRMSSSGTVSSSEELVDQEGGAGTAEFEQDDINRMAPQLPVAGFSGPFRHVGLSKAARTHRLRKLRTPAKCRECNTYVYFQGAECEECCLACHKKCLETLAIQCGHKKLQGRLQLFGQDFGQAALGTPDGIPFIVKKCLCEIEGRALRTKGIYRVNGVKTRVEKLCQAFETGKELVELSQASPHDISNVLKLYLRQLPEPLISFRFYHELVGLAKDSLKAEAEAKAASRGGRQDGSQSEASSLAMAGRLRELLQDLPQENRATLQYLLQHLRRIVEVEQDNKMTPGNLGIVFGPTLLRPRPTEATVSLSSLVDYPHQARVIETLIIHYGLIFEDEPGEGLRAQDEPSSQRSEVVVPVPCLEGREGTTYVLQEEDGGRESRVASNDSDSELEETSDPLSLSEASVLHRLSFLEKQEGEASPEEGPQSRSGSEEQLGDEEEEGPAQQLSTYNTNQSNNTASARLPPTRLRSGHIAGGGCGDRRLEFV